VVRRAVEPSPTPVSINSGLTVAADKKEDDDRGSLSASDRGILIIDNDVDFARFVRETGHHVDFKGILTPSGAAGLALAQQYQPQAILLDISLPDIDGWRVLRRLKGDLSLRHLPVYLVSTTDPDRLLEGIALGAQGILPKPIHTARELESFLGDVRAFVDAEQRTLLIIHPQGASHAEIAAALADLPLKVITVSNADEALAAVANGNIDAVVLTSDIGEPTLAELAGRLARESLSRPRRLFLYPGGAFGSDEAQRWRHVGQELGMSWIESPQTLVDQVSLALCCPVAKLPERAQRAIGELHAPARVLAGKRVLIVDDDIRNIFALTSILERQDVITVSAETGRDAINLLQAAAAVDAVLMDIMMPEMDGIDTMCAIRRDERFKNLPIIAVTAKAMKGDREKCIEAGAWDYLSKPVDPDQMLAVLSAWLTV
ncbi:MAG TPA: response regulator, partial [Gemmataceae bacterium]|nr:response regulator [Gemmataceae bacterium]